MDKITFSDFFFLWSRSCLDRVELIFMPILIVGKTCRGKINGYQFINVIGCLNRLQQSMTVVAKDLHQSSKLMNEHVHMFFNLVHNVIITELLNKPEDQLVMNQADSYRKTQELRYVIDRTISYKDYGKGCKYTLALEH